MNKKAWYTTEFRGRGTPQPDVGLLINENEKDILCGAVLSATGCITSSSASKLKLQVQLQNILWPMSICTATELLYW